MKCGLSIITHMLCIRDLMKYNEDWRAYSLRIVALFVSIPVNLLVCKKAALLTDSFVSSRSDEKTPKQLFTFNLIILMEPYTESNTSYQSTLPTSVLWKNSSQLFFSPILSLSSFFFVMKLRPTSFPKKSQYSVQIHFWWPKQLDAFSPWWSSPFTKFSFVLFSSQLKHICDQYPLYEGWFVLSQGALH